MEFSFEELQRRKVANIQSQFTNAEEMQKAEQDELEKARHGTYADNAQNRKLNRVGQEYGHKAEEKQPSGQRTKKTEEASGTGGKTVADHAADTDSKVLKKVVDDPNAKPELKEAAQAELKKRGEETDKNKEKNKQNNIFDEYTTDVDVRESNGNIYVDSPFFKYKVEPKEDGLYIDRFNLGVKNGDASEEFQRAQELYSIPIYTMADWGNGVTEDDIDLVADFAIKFEESERKAIEALSKKYNKPVYRKYYESDGEFEIPEKTKEEYKEYFEDLRQKGIQIQKQREENRKEELKKQKEEKIKKYGDEMVKKFEEMDNDEEIAELPGVIDGIGYHIADHDIDIKELENEGYSEGDKIWDQLMKEKLLDEVSEHNEKISSAVKKYGVKAVKKYIKENSETIKNSELNAIINKALESSKNK
jgi:hypothetical protein